jgi:hypothetical protein
MIFPHIIKFQYKMTFSAFTVDLLMFCPFFAQNFQSFLNFLFTKTAFDQLIHFKSSMKCSHKLTVFTTHRSFVEKASPFATLQEPLHFTSSLRIKKLQTISHSGVNDRTSFSARSSLFFCNLKIDCKRQNTSTTSAQASLFFLLSNYSPSAFLCLLFALLFMKRGNLR